ncbi:MAG TPA: FAD-binding oxidoreductase [Gaiellaceae bacterium]|nr:FAD-binding oxidoreductase [Gaiellaceae bacterium]
MTSEVVVVGGGLIGLLTACELAERGVRVLVVEKDDIGFEQSARSVAAVNLPGGSSAAAPESILRISADEWAGFEERWGCGIDLNDEGWHVLVADEEDQRWLAIDRALWDETAGYPERELLDARAAKTRFPQLGGSFLALEVRYGGHVDAVRVMQGLRVAAGRLGVEIRRGTLVTGFERAGGTVSAVRAGETSIPCGAVVVAAGVWSSQLCDLLDLHIPMQRVRAPAAETVPLPPGTIPGFLRGSTFGARQNRNGTVRVTGGYRYSAMLHDVSFHDLKDLRLWAPALWKNRKDVSLRIDPRLLAAELACSLARLRGRNHRAVVPQDYNPSARPRDRRRQLEDLARFVPALRGARILRAFAGVIDLTPDLLPVIGRIPGTENAYVSSGYSGHGYIYGPGACRALANLIVDGDPQADLGPFRPTRLEGKLTMREQIF